MTKYAQIDLSSGTVVSESCLAVEVTADHMIPIADDFSPLGKRWTGSGFEDMPAPAAIPILSRQAFIDRLEFAELAALKALTKQATQDGIEAATFWDVVMARDTIALDSPLAQSAKIALQGWGVLTPQRAGKVFGY